MVEWVKVITAEQVDAAVLELIEDIYEGFFADESRIDWDDFLSRVERTGQYDLGGSMTSDAIKAIKKHVRKIRAEG